MWKTLLVMWIKWRGKGRAYHKSTCIGTDNPSSQHRGTEVPTPGRPMPGCLRQKAGFSSRFLPATLELSLTATERLEQERAELDRLWQQRRERAAYEVERAARLYHAVEPEHRLVARTLERARARETGSEASA